MDDTTNKHAYKCLPLTAANVHGWELQLQQDVVVQLDEGNGQIPRVLRGATCLFEGEAHSYERFIVQQSIINTVSFTT